MSLPVSDSFTDTDNTALTSHGGNWSGNGLGALSIISNALFANSASTECLNHWSSDTPNNDQYVQATIKTMAASGDSIGLAVRCNSSTANAYCFYSDSLNSYLFKYVNGVWTQMGLNGSVFSVNDVIRLEVSGTTVTPKVNGSISSIGAQTDSAFASGFLGVSGFSNAHSVSLDDWSGNNLGSSSLTISVSDNISITESIGSICYPIIEFIKTRFPKFLLRR